MAGQWPASWPADWPGVSSRGRVLTMPLTPQSRPASQLILPCRKAVGGGSAKVLTSQAPYETTPTQPAHSVRGTVNARRLCPWSPGLVSCDLARPAPLVFWFVF